MRGRQSPKDKKLHKYGQLHLETHQIYRSNFRHQPLNHPENIFG